MRSQLDNFKLHALQALLAALDELIFPIVTKVVSRKQSPTERIWPWSCGFSPAQCIAATGFLAGKLAKTDCFCRNDGLTGISKFIIGIIYL